MVWQRVRKLLVCWLAAGLGAGVAGCAAPSGERFEFTRLTMGVSTRIVVEAPSREIASNAAAAAYTRIGEIEDAASDYRPQSELMRLCRDAKVGQWQPVSRDLAVLLNTSREVSQRSGGVFDVSVGPAVGLWRQMRKTGTLVDAATIAEARERIDWRAVEVEVDPPRARLMKPGMQLDMGGIAKGHAVREAGRVLESCGLKRCLVALAGDVYAGEAPTGKDGWRIEVRGDKSEEAVGTLVVSHACVSTSGDAEQYVEVAGVRYSHILDPRTGVGTVGGLIVTAIGADGAYVDAADTASVVLGLEGMRAAFGDDKRVTLIVHHGGQPPVIVGDASRVRWAAPASE